MSFISWKFIAACKFVLSLYELLDIIVLVTFGVFFFLSCTVYVHHPKKNPASTRKSDVSFRQQSPSNNEVCFQGICHHLNDVYLMYIILHIQAMMWNLSHLYTTFVSQALGLFTAFTPGAMAYCAAFYTS